MADNNKDIASRNSVIKRNPSVTHPWAANPESSGFVWIHLKGYRILDQLSKGVGNISIPTKPDVQFAFLAPLAITETVAHNWNEYDSLASRLAQKARTAAKLGAEWNGLMKTFSTGTPEDNAKNVIAVENKGSKIGSGQGQFISNWMQKTYNSVSPHSIPKLKVDTPLYYESSDRRNLNFEVTLVAERNPKSDIIDIVHDLMRYSCPNLKGGISIDFPYMFELYTHPKQWLKYSTLALTAVQPTYNAPYINNYPSSCQLQLTFKDMSPLYRGAIEDGTVINVRKIEGKTGTTSIMKASPERQRQRFDIGTAPKEKKTDPTIADVNSFDNAAGA